MEKNVDKLVEIHIDYLAFTFPLSDDIPGETVKDKFDYIKEDLANLFYMTSLNYGELNGWAQNNYDYQITLGEHIVVRFGGKSTMMKAIVDVDNNLKSIDKYYSCMVELKGQACREIEFLSGGNVDYLNIINWFEYDMHGKATRIDIAIDDMSGNIITLKKIINTVKKGLYTSSFRSTPELYRGAVDNDDTKGTSLYFGKSNSNHKNDLELCIYDKASERKFHNDSYVSDYWTRFELRFRNERADHVAYFILKNKFKDIGNFAMDRLSSVLQLKQRTYNGIKSEMKDVRKLDILSSWQQFLNVVQRTNFSLRPVLESTIEKKVYWRSYSLTRQNILLDLADAYDGDDWIYKQFGRVYREMIDELAFLEDSTKKINDCDIEMINNYRRNKGNYNYIDLTKDDIIDYTNELREVIKSFERNYKLPF